MFMRPFLFLPIFLSCLFTFLHSLLLSLSRAALDRGEKPARLLYADCDSRNPFMFPITDENVGVMALKRLPGDTHPLAMCIGTYPRDKELSERPVVKSTGVTVHANTRIESQEDSIGTSTLESMSHDQQRKLVLAGRQAQQEALFDEMVAKGTYSATAIEHERQLRELNRKGGKGRYSAGDLERHGLQTPQITPSHRGYGFVHTPAMDPGINVSPLMTWGRVAATPLLLSGGDEQGGEGKHAEQPSESRYLIPEPSAKELTAQRLQENVSKKLKLQKMRQSDGLRKVLKAMTPMLEFGRRGTPGSDIFHGRGLSGLQSRRLGSLGSATPLSGVTPLSIASFTPRRRSKARSSTLKHEQEGGASSLEEKQPDAQPGSASNPRKHDRESPQDVKVDKKSKKGTSSQERGITDGLLEF